MGYTPHASSIDEDYGTHLQEKGRYQEDSYSHAQNYVHPAETEAEYEVTRYRSEHYGMGSRQVQSNPSQRYAGQCNEGGRARVIFNEAPRYERSTDQVENLDYEQTPQTHDSRNFCTMRNSSRSVTERKCSSPEYYGLKIPPFNGKEDCKTWIIRSEAIAERRNWTEESRFDNLLPKLQGKASDFVFTQLSKAALNCYRELVKELNSRFRLVETGKSFAAKFSQRTQEQMRLRGNTLQISNSCMPKHTRIDIVELSKKTLCEDFWTVCEIMRPALKSNIVNR